MVWYKSQRHNDFKYIFRQWLIHTLVLSTPLLFDFLFPQFNFINRSVWYFFIPVTSFVSFINLCKEDRVNEVIVDTDFREVAFKYYDINEGQVWKSYPFETLRLEISYNKPRWLFEPLEICFLKGKREVMCISKSKDGFSLETLENLKGILHDLTSPVK